jgi:hypothetical protein
MITERQRQELIILLTGTASVLRGSAADYETIARRVAQLDRTFPSRLRRCADEAHGIARVLRTVARALRASGPGRDRSGR